MSDDRPPRYVETDSAGTQTVVYRASSLGACTRSLIATARAYERKPHPQWFQDVLDEGTGAEDAILAMYCEKYDTVVDGAQREVELEIGEVDGRRVIVRGHIDGIDGAGTVVDAKKFRPSTWPKFLSQGVECGVNYPWQMSVYMHALNTNGALIGGQFNTDTGAIDSVERKPLFNPPIPLKAIRKKVLLVEGKINAGYDPNDIECDVRMYPCPYWYLPGHRKDEDNAAATSIEPDDAFLALIAEYNTASQDAEGKIKVSKEAIAVKTKAAADIKQWLRAHGVENANAEVGGWGVAWAVTPVAEHIRKASTRETFTIKEPTT